MHKLELQINSLNESMNVCSNFLEMKCPINANPIFARLKVDALNEAKMIRDYCIAVINLFMLKHSLTWIETNINPTLIPLLTYRKHNGSFQARWWSINPEWEVIRT